MLVARWLITTAKILVTFLFLTSTPAIAQHYWQQLQGKSLSEYQDVRLKRAQIIKLDFQHFLTQFNAQQPTIFLPVPNGKLVEFRLQKNAVMSPQLAAKYPSINTFTGYQTNNIGNKGHFDISPFGFHGTFNYGNKKVFIEPTSTGQTIEYFSYFKSDAQSLSISDKVIHFDHKIAAAKQAKPELDNQEQLVTTYRLAVAATGEYTQFHGGTVESGLAAIVSMVNRLNEIFLTELAIQFELVANNDEIIATDPNTDPYDNDDGDAALNTLRLNLAIGEDNYDIGHIVTTGAGGLAIVGGLCTGGLKGYGVTGLANPTGDAFWVDYVAHEIGHQLGAEHTFNGSKGSCENGRVANSAYEPGSGVTIMAYAGICGSQNLATSGLDQFHSASLDEMNAVIAQRNCGSKQAVSNRIPAVDAGNNYTIPAHTPFTLTGEATDLDGDILSYEWQQFDLGAATDSKVQDMTDLGSGPLFRTFSPTPSPSRTFPQLTDVLSDTVRYGETYPATDRSLNFRFIVRDDAGGVNYDAVALSVINTGEAFRVVSPDGGEVWQEREQLIEWQVADTGSAPINCGLVDIWLSEDGGQNFLMSVVEGTANDGSELVTIPNIQTNTGRIKISCQDNIFFNVSKANFSLDVNYVAIIGQANIDMLEDETLTITTDMFNYEGGQADEISIQAGENYSVAGVTITPQTHYFGQLAVGVTASINQTETAPFIAFINIAPVNDLPSAVIDILSVEQDSERLLIDVLANDSDVESSELTLVSVNYSGQSQVEIVDNKIQYQPAANFSGEERISYTVIDDEQGQASANLVITVEAKASNGASSATSSGGGSGGGINQALLLFLVLSVFHRYVIGRNQDAL